MVTRRRFVGLSLASGAALLAGKSDVIFGADSSTAPTMATNPTWKLGGDLTVNRLGFGAMRITGEGIWGWPPDRQNALKVLRRAVELGVNLIDTADAYGPDTSELLIAEALYPYPKGLVIATKGGLTRPGPSEWVPNCRPEHLKQAVDGSLKRLRLERIDLYQLHTVDLKVPIEASLGALKEAQDAGKIRHVGLSNVSINEIERARKILPIVSVQNRYNIEDRRTEKTLAYCEKEKLGFLPWFPIGGGRGLKRENPLEKAAKDHGVSAVQVALAWLLERSPVMLPIPGTSSVPHLEENIAAAKLILTPEEWKAIDALAS
jgi:pyridoxine 4-dehydrogenase